MAKTNLETVCHVYLDGDLLLDAEVGGGLSLDVAMCLDLFLLLNVYFRWPPLKGVAIPLTRATG